MSQSYLTFEIKDTILVSVLKNAREAYLINSDRAFNLFRPERMRVADMLTYWGVLRFVKGTSSWKLTEFGYTCQWVLHDDNTMIILIPLGEE